ncbi:MAG: hypothetical protein QOE70_1643 [Chthoniobacter sp.]|jgi:hypothetical protein|nr:hypothetical protein [Chthoniobacter sp.]
MRPVRGDSNGKPLALEVGSRITSADQKCFEIPSTEDEGIDMELEFTDDEGKGTDKRLYLQLKSETRIYPSGLRSSGS